ncbi:unknown product [Escherichia phage BA14]|uniref:Uncharacterized protein n=1 Tax=Escherichia phage BA14 TaxID=532074 RepID=B3VCS4_9CAUD|nr:unknown product [Escherichia phage BA14]ACF15779.1 unknown product [Escherichia phage BA14]
MFSTHLCFLGYSLALSALLVIMVDIHLPYNHCKKSTLRVSLMYPLWSTGSLRVSPYDRASVVNLMRLDVPFKNPTEKSEWVSHSSYKVFTPYGLLQFPKECHPLW